MKIKSKYIFYCSIFTLAVLNSCGVGKDASNETNVKRLNDKEAQETLFAFEKVDFKCFYAKIGIEYKDTTRSNSFSATAKMRVDSAFSGTMSVGPIIGATYLVSTDSLFFTDKMNNCYFKEHISYLTTVFGTEIQYQFFQGLILGLPIGLDSTIKYNVKHTKEYYILSSFKKKDLKKIDETEEGDIFVQYYLNTETLYLDQMSIQVPSDSVTIDINYKNRVLYDNVYMPEKTMIHIGQPTNNIFIELDYKSIKLNECKEININIPDSYVKCQSK